MNGYELIAAFQNGRTDFSGEILQGIKIRGAHLNGIKFDSADLRDSDFSGTSLFRASFRGTMLSRAHLGVLHDSVSDPNMDDIDMEMGCVDLAQADLTGAFLNDCHMFRVNLRDANLDHADLRGAILRQSDLGGANLQDANFTRADLSEAHLSMDALKNAITTLATLDNIHDIDHE